MAPAASSQALPRESLLPAIQVSPLSSHTYTISFPSHFCIGSVPHGGYITAVFLSVAQKHFSTTLSGQDQPDAFILNLNFLRRTGEGPALFRVRDVKLGRQTSIIHISLLQGNKDWNPSDDNSEENATEEVVGYITNTNFSKESGPTNETGWSLLPPSPAVSISPSTSSPSLGANWTQITNLPFLKFRKATSHVDLWMPVPDARAELPRARVDQWVRMRSGEKWTALHLGLLSDYFPMLLDFMEPPRADEDPASPSRAAKHWYPTLVLNLDVKKRLPAEGATWLNVVSQMRSVKNGRSDIDLSIFDESGDLVAVSHHVCLVVPVERNTSSRREQRVNSVQQKNESKI